MTVRTATVVTIDDRCTGCGACLATCPEQAIRPGRGGLVVSEARCTACLACIEICPAGAIREGAWW
ncbi:MAG: 4Fe-4S binding protein [Acidimicrobiales bacterium]